MKVFARRNRPFQAFWEHFDAWKVIFVIFELIKKVKKPQSTFIFLVKILILTELLKLHSGSKVSAFAVFNPKKCSFQGQIAIPKPQLWMGSPVQEETSSGLKM